MNFVKLRDHYLQAAIDCRRAGSIDCALQYFRVFKMLRDHLTPKGTH